MTTRVEEVIGGLAEAIATLKPEPGDILVVRCREQPGPEDARILGELLRKHHAGPALIVEPGSTVQFEDLASLGYQMWGSDCTACGNTTEASLRCDLCNSTRHTRPLWVAKQ